MSKETWGKVSEFFEKKKIHPGFKLLSLTHFSLIERPIFTNEHSMDET
jgi:hypothetical protein